MTLHPFTCPRCQQPYRANVEHDVCPECVRAKQVFVSSETLLEFAAKQFAFGKITRESFFEVFGRRCPACQDVITKTGWAPEHLPAGHLDDEPVVVEVPRG